MKENFLYVIKKENKEEKNVYLEVGYINDSKEGRDHEKEGRMLIEKLKQNGFSFEDNLLTTTLRIRDCENYSGNIITWGDTKGIYNSIDLVAEGIDFSEPLEPGRCGFTIAVGFYQSGSCDYMKTEDLEKKLQKAGFEKSLGW